MNEFRGDAVPMVIPDNLSSVQFMLDYHHPRRPLRPANAPWFIDDTTGRPVFLEEAR
jgi:4-coumarate--CoA ligase